ncbi:hypothetical protein ACR77J_07980 [Tissierella praeacuta]|uniref:hypothetical protein n=1 Tax=Tissierella praeacuta TaxID=43131 RepID=UPI003DA208A9
MFKIFDEEKHAQYMLKNGFMLKEFNSYELGVLAKYYFNEDLNRPEVRNKLISFCIKHDKNFDPIISRQALNRLVEYGKKFDFFNIESIKITKNELEIISNMNDFKKEKILFAMLVFSKYRHMINKEKDIKLRNKNNEKQRKGLEKHFVTEKHPTIMKESKVSMSVKDRNSTFRYFEDLGLLRMTMSCNFELYFVDKEFSEDDVMIEIDNFKNFIYYYYQWKDKGKYIRCDVCGCIEKATNNRTKYCDECWKERHREIKRETWHKYKEKYKH